MSMRPKKPFTRNDEKLGRTTYVSCDGFKIHVEGIWGIEYISPTGRVIYKGHHGLELLLRVLDAAVYPGIIYDEAVAEYRQWHEARPKAFRRSGTGSDMWCTREGDKLVDSGKGTYDHYDPQGNLVKTYSFFWDVQDDHRILTPRMHQRTRLKSGIRLNEGHLVPGTRFRTDGFISDRDHDEHVVHSVCTNNPGHWLVSTTTMVPCLITKKPVNDIFAISFISEILERPVGKPLIENSGVSRDDWNLPKERIHGDSWDKVYSYMSNVITRGQCVNDQKLFNRLKAMGMLKWTQHGYIVKDPKKAGKFLARNPHWALHTMAHSRYEAKLESEMFSDMMDI